MIMCHPQQGGGHYGRDCMVVFITTYAIIAYHY